MISKTLILSLVLTLIALTTIRGQTRTTEQIENSRRTAIKIASDSNNLAEVKMVTGEKRKGRINSVETDSFTFSETKSGKSQTIAFSDVDQLKKSRKGLSTGAWIAIGAGAAGAVLFFTFLLPRYCNERAC